MQVKQFFIRLNRFDRINDEDKLNLFLQKIEVLKIISEIVTIENISLWTVLIFYNGDSNISTTVLSKNEILYNQILKNLTTEEKTRYDILRIWRGDAARLRNYPSFIISSNLVLIEIAKTNPKSLYELSTIKGFGENKVINYGEEILLILNSI